MGEGLVAHQLGLQPLASRAPSQTLRRGEKGGLAPATWLHCVVGCMPLPLKKCKGEGRRWCGISHLHCAVGYAPPPQKLSFYIYIIIF